MAIMYYGIYTPGKKPEPSLHDRLKELHLTSYHNGIGKDCKPLPLKDMNRKPLPYISGGCFSNEEEKLSADYEWKENYQCGAV